MRSKLSFVEAIATCFSQCYISTLLIGGEKEKSRNRAQWRAAPSAHHRPPSLPLSATALPLPLLLLLPLRIMHSPIFMLHVNSREQLTTSLRRFHRQPLLFLFLFPFSFSFVFCILHCPKKKNRNRARWRAAPLAHHRPSPFPPPAIALPLPLLLLLRLLHSPLFMLHMNSGEWLASSVSTVPQSITVALLFPFSFSFSFVWAALHCSRCMWTVESVSTVHGPTRSGPNLNTRCLGPT